MWRVVQDSQSDDDEDADDVMTKKPTKCEEQCPGVNWTDASVAPGYNMVTSMKGNEVGNDGLSKDSKKRCVLLDSCVGLTEVNRGLTVMMIATLSSCQGFVTRMQTTTQPVQHRVRDQIEASLRDLAAWPAPGLAHTCYPTKYGEWRAQLLPKGQ